MQRSTAVLALALVALCALVPAGIAAPYSLGTTGDVSVPQQEVTIEGDDYQIGAVGEVQHGETMTVPVSVDGDEEYIVDLYNKNENIEDWRDGSGDGSVSFDTSNMEPGTYALALSVDGKTQAIHPVVVADYEVSISAPSDVSEAEPFEVTVDIGESVATGERVEVGLYRDGTELQSTATSNGDGTYTATLAPDEAGDWSLYAAVRGEGTAGGYPISMGIDNGQTVTVSDEASDGDGSESGGDGTDSDGTDGDGADGDSSDGNSTDGESSDGADGDGTDGDGSDGNSTDGESSDGTGSDGSGSEDTSGGDGHGADDSGGETDDTGGETTNDTGDESAGPGGESNSTDGGVSGGDGDTSVDNDGATDDETDGNAAEGDESANETDGPINPNDPASEDNESETDDNELSIGWVVPVVAIIMAITLAVRRDD